MEKKEKKAEALSDLLKKVPMSEPLETFVSAVNAIASIFSIAATAVDEKEKETKERLLRCEEGRKRCLEIIESDEEDLKKIEQIKKGFERWKEEATKKEDKSEVDKIEEQMQETGKLMSRVKERQPEVKEMAQEFYEMNSGFSKDIEAYNKQREILRPMVFVYLVTIWDAFVLDTVRRILRVHPQVITGGENKIEVSKIWDARTIDDVKNKVIEEVVRELDSDRKKLVKKFGDYWGIDWSKSGIKVDDVVEIRARRDIWVHNNGVVNRQYIDMVGEGTSLNDGEVAEISLMYFVDCLNKLYLLALYIHRIAHEKHYTKVGTESVSG